MGKRPSATRSRRTFKPRPAATRMLADEIARTATQVRLGEDVHALTFNSFDRELGHVYGTVCGDTVTAKRGAVLTTAEATCLHCTGLPSIETGQS